MNVAARAVGRLSGWLVGAAILSAAYPPSRLTAQEQPSVRFSGYMQPRFESVGDTALFFLRRGPFPLHGARTPVVSTGIPGDRGSPGVPPTPPQSPVTLSLTRLFCPVG